MSAAHDIARADARADLVDVTRADARADLDGPVTRMSEPRITTELAVQGAHDLAALDAGLAIAQRCEGLTFIALPAPMIAPTAIVDEFRDAPLVSWASGDLTLVGVGIAREVRGAGEHRWAQVIANAHAIATNTADVDDDEPRDTMPTHLPHARPELRASIDQSDELRVIDVNQRHADFQSAALRDRRAHTGDAVIVDEPDNVGSEPRESMLDDGISALDALLFDAPHRAVIAGELAPTAALGFARPRFVGGAAFAPGAANQAPWTGFGDAWFALPRWTYAHDGSRAFLVLAIDASDATNAARWRDELAIHRAAFAASSARTRGQPTLVELAPAPPDAWRTQVTDITDAIAKGTCSKIVAARTCGVMLAGPIRTADLLAALDDRHADCVRVLVKPPGAGALVAATPERLVRRDGDVVLCDALAGSIAPNGDADAAAARLFASAKDRNEHELVVSALRTALTDAGAHVDAPVEPGFKRLRHIIHLHTPFRAVLRSPRHVLELAARLHPTPAVGGTPHALAAEWIESHEPEARGWYSAPVGWFDLEGNGELCVALRSGVIANNRAHLFAGAGIVAGSDPDKELAETEMKFRAMLNALGVNA
jgi:menaquinone-specific isochorismate synthase